MSPSNKIKLVDDGQTKQIVIYKAESKEAKAYKLTKDLSVKYAKELIINIPEWSIFLNNQKKKR